MNDGLDVESDDIHNGKTANTASGTCLDTTVSKAAASTPVYLIDTENESFGLYPFASRTTEELQAELVDGAASLAESRTIATKRQGEAWDVYMKAQAKRQKTLELASAASVSGSSTSHLARSQPIVGANPSKRGDKPTAVVVAASSNTGKQCIKDPLDDFVAIYGPDCGLAYIKLGDVTKRCSACDALKIRRLSGYGRRTVAPPDRWGMWYLVVSTKVSNLGRSLLLRQIPVKYHLLLNDSGSAQTIVSVNGNKRKTEMEIYYQDIFLPLFYPILLWGDHQIHPFQHRWSHNS